MLAADMILARRKKIFAVSPSPCSAGACACPRWEGGLAPTPGSPSHEGLVGKNSAFSGNFGTWLTCNLKRAPDAACLRQQRPATAQATCFALGCSNYLLIDKGLPTGSTAQLQNTPASSFFGAGQPCNSPGNLFRAWLLELFAHRQRFANWIHSTAAKQTHQLLLQVGQPCNGPGNLFRTWLLKLLAHRQRFAHWIHSTAAKQTHQLLRSGGNPATAQATCFALGCSNYLLIDKGLPTGSTAHLCCKTHSPAPSSERGNPATAQATCFALGCSNYLLIDKGLPTGSTAQLQNKPTSSFFGVGQPCNSPGNLFRTWLLKLLARVVSRANNGE